MSSSISICAICNSKIEDPDKPEHVGAGGLQNFIQKSIERGDNNHLKWVELNELITHSSCRKTYTNPGSVAAAKKRKLSVDLSASPASTTFDYEKLCIFCGERCCVKLEGKKPVNRRRKIHLVTPESNFKSKILEACKSSDDSVCAEILPRFTGVADLSLVGARYHHNCDVHFIKELSAHEPTENIRNNRYAEQFENLYKILESAENPQWTLDEIIALISEPSPSRKYVKQVLVDRYENNIIFSSRGRNRTIVTLTGFTKDIFMDYFKSSISSENDADKKSNILNLASKYLRDDIRCYEIDNEYYPPSNEFFDDGNIIDVVPESLRTFLGNIILPLKKNLKTYTKKVTAISHAIMCATRPKSFISPLQLARSLYIHTKYQSKLLINILHRLGMCASYDETLLYEGSAMMTLLPFIEPTCNSFVQFVHDNADYDTNTIDGKNTFHYTAGIQTITPENSTGINLSIQRLKKLPTASAMANKFKVKIYYYTVPEIRGLQHIKIKDIRALRTLESNDTHLLPGEILWTAGHYSKTPDHPGWSGFMELRTNSAIFDVSKIKYLPFIYLKATDNSAIFSAMMFGIKEAKKIQQKNVFFTFDQQLKAREILADVQQKFVRCDENMDHVFIRLGGFHLIMSFLNCIGKIMEGSGLKEVWSLIYAEKSTDKMLTGKRYSRAVRAHYYTQAALLLIIIKECNFKNIDILVELLAIDPSARGLKKRLDEQTILEELEANSAVKQFVEAVRLQMNVIGERGKTARLWVQYVKMVSLFRSFIQAERAGNFNLHLSTIIDMIPFFHVCNHFNYAKCAHLYVQDNLDLDIKMQSPEEFQKYVSSGYFTIRRTNKFFCGVSTDMVVEQTMMRSIHCVGGLVHGRGITESVAASWLNTLNCSAYINDDLEEFCQLESTYSEQHKDLRDHSISRDTKDLETLIKWFEEHNPFPAADAIMSLSTGVSGSPDVNCYNAEYIGLQAYDSIIPSYSIQADGSTTVNEKDFGTIKFTQEFQVIPLSISSRSIKIGQNKFPIDDKILFTRFEKSNPDPSNYSKYSSHELCPFPIAIFESPIMIRKPNDDFFTLLDHTEKPHHINFFVIDGETLLKQCSWAINTSYKSIYEPYAYFLRQNYGYQCVIVFDSMVSDLASIKQSEKLLSLPATAVTTEIYFDESKSATKKKEILFQNSKNKERFIEQLIKVLRRCKFTVIVTQNEDVNRRIVDEAILKSTEKFVTVISDNVDVLCILAAFTPIESSIYFNSPGNKWYSTSIIQNQYQSLYRYLHVIRAITGCDITSSFYNVSKKTCLKRFIKNQDQVSQYLHVLTLTSSSEAIPEIIDAAEKIVIMMYNGNSKNLDELRCQKYSASLKVSRKTNFNIATLPPTSAAAFNHFLRVY